MKPTRTAQELETMVRAELAQHHDVPGDLTLTIIRDGASWRVSSVLDPDAPERGELIARAVEIGDELARHYELKNPA
jgi:hypothetical protein